MNPLRNIVKRINEERISGGTVYTVEIEVLECGHEQLRKQDMYGYTNAYRRRCKKCG